MHDDDDDDDDNKPVYLGNMGRDGLKLHADTIGRPNNIITQEDVVLRLTITAKMLSYLLLGFKGDMLRLSPKQILF